MRGKGASKDKNSSSGVEYDSSTISCGRQCVCETKARLAHKHEINQMIANRNSAASLGKSSNEVVTNEGFENRNTIQTTKMINQDKTVDDLVNFVEGNRSINQKKKMKKERQKQERLQQLKQQEEEERRLKEAIAKEQKRIQDEEKSKKDADQQMPQMSKKQRKKLAQKATEKGNSGTQIIEQQSMHHSKQSASNFSNPLTSSPLLQLSSSIGGSGSNNALSSLEDLKAQLNNLTNNSNHYSSDASTNLNSIPSLNKSKIQQQELEAVQSLQQLKAKHQRELEMLRLKHKHALEEEEMKALHRESEEVFIYQQRQTSKCSFPIHQSIPSEVITPKSTPLYAQSNIKTQHIAKNKVCSKNTNNRLQEANHATISASAADALAKAKKNPGNQIRISRNAQGGVDFTTIPAERAKLQDKVLDSAPKDMSPTSTSHLPNETSKHYYPNIPLKQEKIDTNVSNTRNSEKSNGSHQPMVTIRRVEDPNSSESTITISQAQKTEDNKIKDRLLYKVVNGEVLKADDASNLIPGAKPMPPNILQSK